MAPKVEELLWKDIFKCKETVSNGSTCIGPHIKAILSLHVIHMYTTIWYIHSKKWAKTVFNWNYLDVSENRGTPKSSIWIGFSIINHPFWGTTIFGNTHFKFQSFFYQQKHDAKRPPPFDMISQQNGHLASEMIGSRSPRISHWSLGDFQKAMVHGMDPRIQGVLTVHIYHL